MKLNYLDPGKDKKLKVSLITMSDEENLLAKKGVVSRVNSKGFDLILNHKDLIISPFQITNPHFLFRQHIWMYLPVMEIDLDGVIQHTKYLEKGNFELHINYFKQSPMYWYECFSLLWGSSFSPQSIH